MILFALSVAIFAMSFAFNDTYGFRPQIFLHLADTQNFAKTATQNHMSPSTLSRQIQRMEEEVEQR